MGNRFDGEVMVVIETKDTPAEEGEFCDRGAQLLAKFGAFQFLTRTRMRGGDAVFGNGV